jgi:hypothetical protein
MVSRSELIKASLLSSGLALLTLIPYILAVSLAEPERIFSGFLINPIDGFSYLAKMRQGAEGNWLFLLPYTAEPGKGSLIFLYFLFLGQLTQWTGIEAISLYHIIRMLAATGMFITAYVLISHFIVSKRLRWCAFSLVLLGAGLGWIGLPFNILASDLWIVESIPFQTAYANAHFPLATILFLALMILILSDHPPHWRRRISALCLSMLLSLIQPFSLIALFAILFFWILWETWIQVSPIKKFNWKSELGEKWIVFGMMILGAAPIILYDFWLTVSHPQIAAWNTQNKTPSPPVIEFILGFGAVLFLAVLGVITKNFRVKSTDRFLLTWFVVQAVLIYAPFGLQRRFSHGLYFALVPLAVITLERMIKEPKRMMLAFVVLLIISMPSILIVVGSGLFGVANQDPAVVLHPSEKEAYDWLVQYAEPDRLVLAGPRAGNRIPAYANLRVLYGHPFETIDSENQLVLVKNAYSNDLSEEDALTLIQDQQISYIFFGPEEQGYGNPSWLDDMRLVFSSTNYSIYETSIP